MTFPRGRLSYYTLFLKISDTQLSDSYLTEQRFDPEDDLSFYGSPFAQAQVVSSEQTVVATSSGVISTALHTRTQVSVECFYNG